MRSKCRFFENDSSNLKTERKLDLAESFNQKEISGYWCHTWTLKPLESGFWRILHQNASKCRFLENNSSNLKTDHEFELAESFNEKEISGYLCHTWMLKSLESGFGA